MSGVVLGECGDIGQHEPGLGEVRRRGGVAGDLGDVR